jgi:hypothetical protein
VIFALMGQTLFGGEWLFNDHEAKVAAYVLVLAGLAMALDGRPFAAAVLCAAATYFHFLVGGFWFLAHTLLLLIEDPRGTGENLFGKNHGARAPARLTITVAGRADRAHPASRRRGNCRR